MKQDPLLAKTLRLRAQREERDRNKPRPRPRAAHHLTLHEELDFGKHRGKTVADVIEQDRAYLVWLLENSNYYDLAPDAQAEFDAVDDPRRVRARWADR